MTLYLDSSNSVKSLCVSRVLSTSVCVARSPVDFCSATTEAERRPLVVSVPIPLRAQRAKAPTRHKVFLLNYGKQKKSINTCHILTSLCMPNGSPLQTAVCFPSLFAFVFPFRVYPCVHISSCYVFSRNTNLTRTFYK